MKVITLIVSICLIVTSVMSDQLPVFIWGPHSEPENSIPVSALDNIEEHSFRDYVNNILNSPDAVLYAFVQKKLSLEDFSLYKDSKQGTPFKHLKENLEHQKSVFMPSVDNPVQVLQSLKNQYRVEEFHLSDHEDIPEISNTDVAIFYLPSSDIVAERRSVLANTDDIMDKTLKSAFKGKSAATALLTGQVHSWITAADQKPHIRVARQAVADKEQEYKMFEADCILLYAKQLSITVRSNDGNITCTEVVNLTTANFDISKSNCNESRLVMTFSGGSSENISEINAILQLKNSSGNWGILGGDLSATCKGSEERTTNFIKKDVDIPKGFSYSCYKTDFGNRNISLSLFPFQVQAWKRNSSDFSPSFDCSTFFTIPIWMGLLTILFLTFILATAIYALLDAKTMDHFDDPKGKTISIPVSD